VQLYAQSQSYQVTLEGVAADDGYIYESSETSGTGGDYSATGNIEWALRAGDASDDRQVLSILSFDTSSLPDDANVTAAEIGLIRGALAGTSPFGTHGNLVADIRNGVFNGNVALEAADFQASATSSAVATFGEPQSQGATATGTLNATGRSNINRTGKTQFRVRFTTDDNDDGGADYMCFHAADDATASNRPKIVITYY